MLKITIPENEMWDEVNERFVQVKETTISLEHSLVSISKWEAKYHKSFINTKEKSVEEIVDYIKFMTLTQNVPDVVYLFLTEENYKSINDYISDPMTASSVNDEKKTGRGEVMTSELLYYYMFANGIPKECEKWHLNRLIMLIKIFGAKSEPPQKMNKVATAKKWANLNAQRRKALGTKG